MDEPVDDPPMDLVAPPDSSFERVEIPLDVTNVMAIDGQAPGHLLSRFQIVNDRIDSDSEVVVLQIPEEREERRHVAGGTDFDSQRNLYIAAGDDADPFDSNGSSPHDERPGRRIHDAQRSAANTRDLRGKILRIRPTDDGGYEIPEGNLFTVDQGAPEIYIMGNRNPFRQAIDPATDWLYWGEVGPDAGGDNPARGPRGHDEVNQAKGPGFFGWPYCIGDNFAYVYADFSNVSSRGSFDCSAPINESANNTGLRELPPAQPAWIVYSYGNSPYSALGQSGGRTATVADVYRWAPEGSPNRLPRYCDGSVILMEYTCNYIAEVRTDGEGNVQEVNSMLDSFEWSEIIRGRISPKRRAARRAVRPRVHRPSHELRRERQPRVTFASSSKHAARTRIASWTPGAKTREGVGAPAAAFACAVHPRVVGERAGHLRSRAARCRGPWRRAVALLHPPAIYEPRRLS